MNLLLSFLFPKIEKCDKEIEEISKVIKQNSTYTYVEKASISNFILGIQNTDMGRMIKMTQKFYKNISKERSKIFLNIILQFLKSKATTFILEENVLRLIQDGLFLVGSKDKKIEEEYLEFLVKKNKVKLIFLFFTGKFFLFRRKKFAISKVL